MATVILDFLPPEDTDIVTLHVGESPDSDGVFTELATHPSGSYPDYISKVTVTDAVSVDDWFRIAWENDSGGMTQWSDPVQGNTTTYLSKLIDRVLLRAPNLNENVVAQEAEAIIEEVLHVDPYASDSLTVKYKIWNGMTLMTIARAQLTELAAQTSSSASWTAGLVSLKSDSASALTIQGVRDLIDEASRLLGYSSGRIAQMVVPEIACGYTQVVMADISRLEIDVA
jgi:hypothetical protein